MPKNTSPLFPPMTGKPIWELYPNLAKAVKETHDEYMRTLGCKSFYCHDFAHAVRVGHMATRIAEDVESARLAGAAGLCHNADRILQKLGGLGRNGMVDDHRIIGMTKAWLSSEPTGTFSPNDRDQIIEGVLKHGMPNVANGGVVLALVQDADRVVNTAPDVYMRSGQYVGDDMPAIDPIHLTNDPCASFKNPGGILRAEKEKLDWEEVGGFVGLRMPKARVLAAPNFAFLRQYIWMVESTLAAEGVYPFPKI